MSDLNNPPVPLPATAPPGTPRAGVGYKGKHINLLELAKAHRALLWCVLARIIVEVAGVGAIQSANNPPLLYAYLGAVVIVSIITIVFVVRVALAYGYNPVLAVIGALIVFLGCIGLLVLLLLSQRITRTLKDAGCSVGLMGVSDADMDRLRQGA